MVFHRTTAEHLQKLRRIVERLKQEEMHGDDMDDFCKTAWHLIELIQKDPRSSKEMRRGAERLRSDPDFILCEHAANAEKHGRSRPQTAMEAAVSEVDITQGYNVGEYGKGAFGVGEQSIVFKFENGTERNAFDFADAVLHKMEALFGSETTLGC